MKMLFQSRTDFLVLVPCDVNSRSHPLNEQQKQTTLLEDSYLILSFAPREPEADFVAMEMPHWTYRETLR